MATGAIWDTSRVSLATAAPTARQRRAAFAVSTVVLAAWTSIAPIGAVQLGSMAGFVPATEAALVVCDLVVAALLASQAAAAGSRAVLVLAGGFLFDALVIVPHALTFPDAFAPFGLFGAGLQTTAYLFIFWHFGLPAAIIGYVCLPREPRALSAATFYRDTALVVGLVLVLTWIVTAHGDALPALFVDKRGFTPLANAVTGFDLLVSVVALLALLARRQKSVLDLWLMVAVVALVAELAVTTFIITSRFSIGFYASRLLSLGASVVILFALLAETIGQGLRLARTNLALELERSRKLTTLDAALGAITHEVKQPISSIVANAEAAQIILERPAPNIEDLREIASEIVDSSFRANEIFKNIRGLFKNSREDFQKVDVNHVISAVMRGLRVEMDDCRVARRFELASNLPVISAHAGQLQEVVFNLVRNALDAMKSSPNSARTLRVCTAWHRSDAIGISVQDSGPGIAPGQIERIFDPFVTTKKDGMGMGLAICRMIVERHGGQLSASSNADIGARFEITLPIEAAAEPVEQPETVAATARHTPFSRRQRRPATVARGGAG